MLRFRHIVLSVLFLLLPLAAGAAEAQWQDSLLLRYHQFSAWCSPEKVYLHFDRSCYTAGETLWFKGWVQEASRLSKLPPSKFLYVEVLDEQGAAAVRVKIKRGENGFAGCIELPENLETGYYTLRAYTLWQLNHPGAYLFHDRIRIIGGRGKEEKPAEVPPAEVDISFWPEGGRYFTGQKAVMGFKVVDKLGKSMDFFGILVSDKDGELAPVLTTHDGMGIFAFQPKPGHLYSVRDASGRLHPLPPPSSEGATLQLRINAGRYYISAIGYGGGSASLLVRDATELRPVATLNLDGKMNTRMIAKSSFRPGINHFLLVDSQGRILSERLFFIRDPEAPVCKLTVTHFEKTPRALTRGVISLRHPNGAPLDGYCSVSVVRGVLKDWQQSDGITSYMGLSSELKGAINQPYYYFDPEIPEQQRDNALDVLMLIQGWRYYDLEKIVDVRKGRFILRYLRELMQEIRGRVTRRVSNKIPRKFTFTFMIPKQKVIYSMDVDQGRDFIIDSLDFPENTEFLINIGTSRLGAHYIPRWNGDPFAPPFRYKPAPGKTGDVRMMAPLMNETASFDTLQAAVVTASYQEKDVLTFGHSYREDLETYKEMTLVEYLSMKKATFEYDGEHMYNRTRRRHSAAFADEEDPFSSMDTDEGGASGRVKLIVEDSEEDWWSYDMLRLSDLRALSISSQPDPLYGGDGGVVHISVKPGGLRKSEERNPSLLYFVPLGYQTPRYFKAPRYDRGADGPYDKRNTLWWSPNVKIERSFGRIAFCNSDEMDYPYTLRIEGVSADGRPFSLHATVSPE